MNYRKLIYNIGYLFSVNQAGLDELQMQMAELYLILTEALVEQGDGEAKQWVGAVRSLGSVNMPPKSQDGFGGLVEAVKNERRVELAEEGQRIWDLVRWNAVKEELDVNPPVKSHFFSDYLPGDNSWKYDELEFILSASDIPEEKIINGWQEFIDTVRNRSISEFRNNIIEGHRSATIPHLANIAYRTGRTLSFDPVEEQFVNDNEANGYLSREYREPYNIPETI